MLDDAMECLFVIVLLSGKQTHQKPIIRPVFVWYLVVDLLDELKKFHLLVFFVFVQILWLSIYQTLLCTFLLISNEQIDVFMFDFKHFVDVETSLI